MITGGRILEVKGTKHKDAPVQQLGVNVNIEDLFVRDGTGTVKYTYTISYEPKLAEIEVVGELFFDDKATADIKKAEADWKKSRMVPPQIAEEVLSAVTYSGSAVGTLVAFALNISAPINVPRARLAPAEKVGKAG
ncbi:MAG: hypothetical protein WC792_05310 [Candidatus Micrarchaeia archaeon]|jgi:hypothetical protein